VLWLGLENEIEERMKLTTGFLSFVMLNGAFQEDQEVRFREIWKGGSLPEVGDFKKKLEAEA
jgi:hypothetical protein